MIVAMSVFLSMLLVQSTLAHRVIMQEKNLQASHVLQIGQESAEFEVSMQTNHVNSITAADECNDWCARKVERPKTKPDGSIEDSEKCKEDEKKMPWNKQCTWNIVCSYNSGKCKACPQCRSRCESWCEAKVGRLECGKDAKRACTLQEVCGFGDGIKCSDCGICKVPTTTEKMPVSTGCEDWCAKKIGKKECDDNTNVCSWGKVCTWSSGKCSKCSQCPVADPSCSLGVRSKLGGKMKALCCKHTCGIHCGGPDCAKDGRDSADCCGGKILSATKSCKTNLPPCTLEVQAGGNNGSSSMKTQLWLVLTVFIALAVAA